MSDEHLAVGARTVVLAAGVVLRQLRDPEFLAASAPESAEAAEGADPALGGWRGWARKGGRLARDGAAAGLQRWASVRPGTEAWQRLGVEERTDWWLAHLGRATVAAAAAPGLAGVAGDRVPVSDLVAVAGQGLVLCAVAGEYGIDDVDDQARLIAHAVLGRDRLDLPARAASAAAREAAELTVEIGGEVGVEIDTPYHRITALGRSLVAVGRTLLALQEELDERPRGHTGHRLLGKVPVVGAVSHYRSEQRGLAIVAERGRAWCARHVAAPTTVAGA